MRSGGAGPRWRRQELFDAGAPSRQQRGRFSATASFRRARSSSCQEVDRMTSLRGKLAVVTGASSGVGKATVEALVAEGARVTAVARRGDGLRALRADVGPGVETVQADASD